MGCKEKFIETLCEYCDDDSHGYNQGNRDGNPDVDCSSLMYICARAAGYDMPDYNGSTWSMLADFQNAGWRAEEYEMQDLWSIPGGCIMLNVENHTEGVIANGEWGGAHIDENGYITDGLAGDQTGNEVGRCNPYHFGSYPNDWDYILYPPDDGDSDDSETDNTPFNRADGETGSGVCYEVHTKAGWLGHLTKCDDSDDGYAGYQDQPIDGIRAYRMDGEPLRIQTLMDDGSEWSWTEFVGTLRGSNEENDGYAGDIDSGHYIIGLRVEGAQVRVAVSGQPWLGWETYGETTAEGDDFAGEDLEKKLPIAAIQMRA